MPEPTFPPCPPGAASLPPAGSPDLSRSPARCGPTRTRTCSRGREEAAAWLRKAALLPAEAGLSNSEHAALLRLRDSIRDVLAAHAEGRADDAADARLTRALADGRLVLTVGPNGAPRLASAARASYPNLVAAVAIAIAESGDWPGGG